MPHPVVPNRQRRREDVAMTTPTARQGRPAGAVVECPRHLHPLPRAPKRAWGCCRVRRARAASRPALKVDSMLRNTSRPGGFEPGLSLSIVLRGKTGGEVLVDTHSDEKHPRLSSGSAPHAHVCRRRPRRQARPRRRDKNTAEGSPAA